MSHEEPTFVDAQSLAAMARLRATLDADSVPPDVRIKSQDKAVRLIDEDAITERPQSSRTTSFRPSLNGNIHSSSGSHSSLATTLVRRSSTSTGSRSVSFHTPPESISERRTSSFSGGSGTQNSESPAKTKKSKLTSFFSLKEPSTLAFAEMRAMMEEERKKNDRLAVPTGKIPQNVPAVNSRWDGLPENARQKQKARGRKLKEKAKFRADSKYHIPIQPIGPISYETLDPKAHGEMLLAPSLTLEGHSSPDESLPRTPTTPRSPPLPTLKPSSKWAEKQPAGPAPVSREDAAPWEFMEGPPEPSDNMKTRPSTAVSVSTTRRGKKFALFGKR
jgi:hypothetical protein